MTDSFVRLLGPVLSVPTILTPLHVILSVYQLYALVCLVLFLATLYFDLSKCETKTEVLKAIVDALKEVTISAIIGVVVNNVSALMNVSLYTLSGNINTFAYFTSLGLLTQENHDHNLHHKQIRVQSRRFRRQSYRPIYKI